MQQAKEVMRSCLTAHLLLLVCIASQLFTCGNSLKGSLVFLAPFEWIYINLTLIYKYPPLCQQTFCSHLTSVQSFLLDYRTITHQPTEYHCKVQVLAKKSGSTRWFLSLYLMYSVFFFRGARLPIPALLPVRVTQENVLFTWQHQHQQVLPRSLGAGNTGQQVWAEAYDLTAL